MDRTPCRRLGLSRIHSTASKRTSLQPDKTIASGQSRHDVQRIHNSVEFSTPTSSHTTHGGCSTPVQGCNSGTESVDNPAAQSKLYGNSNSYIEGDASCADDRDVAMQGKKRKSEVLREESDEKFGEDKQYPSRLEVREPSLKQVSGGSSVTPPTLGDLTNLRERVTLKEKKVKELQLAQLYRKKHDPEKLSQAVQQWLHGCQEALQEVVHLLSARGQPVSMTELLSQLRIPPDLVHYNVEEQEFD